LKIEKVNYDMLFYISTKKVTFIIDANLKNVYMGHIFLNMENNEYLESYKYNFVLIPLKDYFMTHFVPYSFSDYERVFYSDDGFYYYRFNIKRYYHCKMLVPWDDKLLKDYDYNTIRFTVYEFYNDYEVTLPNMITFDDGISERILRERNLNVYSDTFEYDVSQNCNGLEIIL
jgi:hypothetical protein